MRLCPDQLFFIDVPKPTGIALLVLACALPFNAQKSVPLFQNTIETPFLEQAKASADRAKAAESRKDYLQAVKAYESEIVLAQQSPILSTSYAVNMVLASAHLDAARLRMKYADSLKDLSLHEQNQVLITGHLDQVPTLVVAAKDKVGPEENVEKFKCRAYELLGHGAFLRGTLNRSPHDIETAITAYERTLPCDAETAPQTKQIISYLKSTHRNMSDGFWTNDNIEKMVSKVVSLSTGKWGSYLSAGIDYGYQYAKAHPGKPPL
jgi:hypothetical protein